MAQITPSQRQGLDASLRVRRTLRIARLIADSPPLTPGQVHQLRAQLDEHPTVPGARGPEREATR